jgi:hypothetical protein
VFEARGVGRVQESLEVLAGARAEERVLVRAERDNPYNPQALLDRAPDGTRSATFPDYSPTSWRPSRAGPSSWSWKLLEARRVTFAPAPVVYRVLCRYTCRARAGARAVHVGELSAGAGVCPAVEQLRGVSHVAHLDHVDGAGAALPRQDEVDDGGIIAAGNSASPT